MNATPSNPRLLEQMLLVRAYEEAIALVERIRSLAGRGVEPSWNDYLEELRFRFKAKRNFMKLLAGLGGASKSQGTN